MDGNQRTALIAMLTFIELNAKELSATDSELAAWIIGLGSGTIPEQLADQLRPRIEPIP